MRTVAISNGSIREEPPRDLCQILTACRVDLKTYSAKSYRETCGGELKLVYP